MKSTNTASSVPVAVRLPKSMSLRLQAEAYDRGITVSALIRTILSHADNQGAASREEGHER